MLIRSEAPADLVKLDRWWRDDIIRPYQADQLKQWREAGLISLSLLATSDMGEVQGHIVVIDAQMDNNSQEIALWHSPDPDLLMPLLNEAESTLFEFGYTQLKIMPSAEAARAEFAPIQANDTWWYKQLAAATA